MVNRREDGSAGHGLHHRAVRDQQVRHLQPRARCSSDIERVPGTLEAPRSDNPTWMISSNTYCGVSKSLASPEQREWQATELCQLGFPCETCGRVHIKE